MYQYEIGQIAYIVHEETQTILPAKVVEEINIKTVDGNHTTWRLLVGPKGKQQVVKMSKVNGEVFPNLKELKATLSKRFEIYLEDVTGKAQKKASSWFTQQKPKQPKPVTQQQANEDYIDPSQFDDSDVEEPEYSEQPNQTADNSLQQENSEDQSKEAIRARLRAMAQPTDDDAEANS